MSAVARPRIGLLPGSLLSASVLVSVAYLLGLAGAELLVLTTGILAGAVAHTVLITILVGHAIAAPRAPYRRLLVALTLPSVLRLLGLVVPVAATSEAVWYLSAGTPALIAVGLAARVVGMPASLLAWPRSAWLQLLIAVSGITNGLLAYLVLRPAPIGGGAAVASLTAAAVILFGAVVEELAFRGIMQSVATELFRSPGAGIAVATVAFSVMYVGSLSIPFVLLMFAMGLFLSWTVQETGSLWGALGAHAAMVVGLVVVWPLLLT
jgi:membrane protease YdiL (CAAX protease family)